MEQLRAAYRYPFSAYGSKEIGKHANLLRNEYLVSEAKKRLEDVLRSGSYPIPGETDSEEKMKEELAIYAICRLVITHLNNNYLTNRFAVAYSKSFHSARVDGNEDSLDDELLSEFSIRASKDKGNYTVDIFSYIKYLPNPVHYNLFYKEVAKGIVKIRKEELGRLVEEAVKRHLEKIPNIEKRDAFYNSIGRAVLAKMPAKEGPKITFKEGDNPPCIEKLLNDMRTHKNLNHYARWSLAVYLANRGMEKEDMLRLYANSPDYNEKISSYQIGHVIERQYKMPACDKMRLYGLCIAECGISNPIQWGERRGRKAVDKRNA